MTVDILMPTLSPGMEKGHLARWLKQKGDAIAAGDVIAEIETDKATLELAASEGGVLSEILVPGGTSDVPVNQRIAVLNPGSAAAPPEVPTKAAPPASVDPLPEAAALAIDASTTEGPSDRLFASPRARRLSEELGVDLAGLQGSGPQGRILERNVRDALAAAMARLRSDFHTIRPEPREAPVPGKLAAEPRNHGGAGISLTPICLTSLVDVEPLLALLEQINEAAPRGRDETPVTLSDTVIKAWAQVLRVAPIANPSLGGGEAIRHDHAEIALVHGHAMHAPVMRQADRKGIGAIAREAAELAGRADAGTLLPEECAGGTSSAICLTTGGVGSVMPAIRPGHATALACGAVETRLPLRGDPTAASRVMTVTVAFDPRLLGIDTGAELIGALRSRLEAPLCLLV